jgi:type II secretory pathway component GspD/PulD (secretin)
MQTKQIIGLVALIAVVLIAVAALIISVKTRSDPRSALRIATTHTFSSFDPPTPGEKSLPAQTIKFEQADLAQVLNLYAEISGRSVIRGENVPEAKITFSNQTPMNSVEVLQALDTVLAAQGITTVILGTQFVKIVSEKDAAKEAVPVIELQPNQLPDSSSYLMYIVKMKKVNPSGAIPALQPFQKLPQAILAIDSGGGGRPASKANIPNLPVFFSAKEGGLLIFRDYSSNVRRMLQVLEKLEEQ